MFVHEHAVAVRSGLVLKGQRNEIAKPAARHRILVREEPIVRRHAQLVATAHRVRDEVTTHLACSPRRHGCSEEEPWSVRWTAHESRVVCAVEWMTMHVQGGIPSTKRSTGEGQAESNLLVPQGCDRRAYGDFRDASIRRSTQGVLAVAGLVRHRRNRCATPGNK
jgi:hypothetical protein